MKSSSGWCPHGQQDAQVPPGGSEHAKTEAHFYSSNMSKTKQYFSSLVPLSFFSQQADYRQKIVGRGLPKLVTLCKV